MALHRPGCLENLRPVYSGFAERGQEFIFEYDINVPFDIECSGCCLDYLVTRRHYQLTTGSFNRVFFAAQDQNNVADVACFVQVSRKRGGGRYGQIATGTDVNLGHLAGSTCCQLRKYQIYGTLGGMGVSTQVIARMESLAIDGIRSAQLELSRIYFDAYADGALLELYRCDRGMSSLAGICTLKPVDDVSSGIAKLEL